MQKWSADITKPQVDRILLGRDFQLKSGAPGRLLVKAGRNIESVSSSSSSSLRRLSGRA